MPITFYSNAGNWSENKAKYRKRLNEIFYNTMSWSKLKQSNKINHLTYRLHTPNQAVVKKLFEKVYMVYTKFIE